MHNHDNSHNATNSDTQTPHPAACWAVWRGREELQRKQTHSKQACVLFPHIAATRNESINIHYPSARHKKNEILIYPAARMEES